ncbi:hypothetical protein BJ992_002315 [Sphaerisporangium rubeum]|uniref:Uncharacterized protein n=1 Tax=Sphaerisporangium rubeum TaxID=321317 RepID=A0A7X0IE58_9ACTN|nr:hypothetical protein [Sphaerisporangium rubeum]
MVSALAPHTGGHGKTGGEDAMRVFLLTMPKSCSSWVPSKR